MGYFQCSTCGRRFADPSTIRRHQTTVHAPTKFFECPICGRNVSRKDNYRVHMKSHSGATAATTATISPNTRDEFAQIATAGRANQAETVASHAEAAADATTIVVVDHDGDDDDGGEQKAAKTPLDEAQVLSAANDQTSNASTSVDNAKT